MKANTISSRFAGAFSTSSAKLVGDLDVEVAGNRVGEARRIVDLRQLHRGFGRHLLVELGISVELVDDRTHQRRGIDTVVDGISDRLDVAITALPSSSSDEAWRCLPSTSTDGAVGQFQKLQHRRDDAGIVKVIAHGVVLARIELGDEKISYRLPSPLRARRPNDRGRRTAAQSCAERRQQHAGQKGKRLVHQGS